MEEEEVALRTANAASGFTPHRLVTALCSERVKLYPGFLVTTSWLLCYWQVSFSAMIKDHVRVTLYICGRLTWSECAVPVVLLLPLHAVGSWIKPDSNPLLWSGGRLLSTLTWQGHVLVHETASACGRWLARGCDVKHVWCSACMLVSGLSTTCCGCVEVHSDHLCCHADRVRRWTDWESVEMSALGGNWCLSERDCDTRWATERPITRAVSGSLTYWTAVCPCGGQGWDWDHQHTRFRITKWIWSEHKTESEATSMCTGSCVTVWVAMESEGSLYPVFTGQLLIYQCNLVYGFPSSSLHTQLFVCLCAGLAVKCYCQDVCVCATVPLSILCCCFGPTYWVT